MRKSKHNAQGFTLIASMLLLVLLSSIAIGLMFLANGSGRVGNNDLEANVAYYGAESGMEKLTTDLLSLYQQKLSPTQADLDNLALNSPPSSALVGNMSYLEKAFWTNPGAGGLPVVTTSVIGHGPYTGLTAEIIPITLQVSAMRPSGAAVNMTRGVQVALIPVFQFGVFSDSDLSYFPGPYFDFRGRVHTNGTLFLAADSGPLQMDSNVTAVNEIIRDRLANGFSNGSNYQGNVLLPNATGGCASAGGSATSSCLNLGVSEGSWVGGVPPGGGPNSGWTTIQNRYNGLVTNHVKPLLLPFVQGSTLSSSAQQIQIIKEPLAGELPTTPIGASREFNKADIRVMLADTPAELHPAGGAVDAQDINLAGYVGAVAGGGTTAMAMGLAGSDPGWPGPPAGEPNPWPLVSGYLRVEYLDTTGNWQGVTQEWLQQGFARGFDVASSVSTANTAHPNAILAFQKLADRNSDGALTAADAPSNIFEAAGPTANSWYPINFYDPREGFPRDNSPLGGTQCYLNGIMNAVELNVGNLKRWLAGNIGTKGPSVDATPQNGYLVYFSDRRGQSVIAPKVAEYGFEDVINSGAGGGMPDGVLDLSVAPSPEDVDQDGLLDNRGAENVGIGFRMDTTNHNPYQSLDCVTLGRSNRVTGARHVLKLVNGSLNNLPMPGFTVAAENPVYVQGDYNSNAADTVWTTSVDVPHAAAAVIADAVTLLSANWTDATSMAAPNSRGTRDAGTAYYRMAIAAGKNINFPQPAGGGNDFGTDGGVHNFLRYIEDWGPATLNYRGSLVSLYYSQYATGVFKCCNLVYSPPRRNYSFDTNFLTPSKLPPGTPMLQDIENLTYWQNFAPCTTQSGGTCSN
jgi:Tfp pilus assembly protein PilX